MNDDPKFCAQGVRTFLETKVENPPDPKDDQQPVCLTAVARLAWQAQSCKDLIELARIIGRCAEKLGIYYEQQIKGPLTIKAKREWLNNHSIMAYLGHRAKILTNPNPDRSYGQLENIVKQIGGIE